MQNVSYERLLFFMISCAACMRDRTCLFFRVLFFLSVFFFQVFFFFVVERKEKKSTEKSPRAQECKRGLRTQSSVTHSPQVTFVGKPFFENKRFVWQNGSSFFRPWKMCKARAETFFKKQGKKKREKRHEIRW